MSTNKTGFRWFQESLRSCALDESGLSIVRVEHIRASGSFCAPTDKRVLFHAADSDMGSFMVSHR